MKNLKLILGLVVVMTTIEIKCQVTTPLSFDDFEIIHIEQDSDTQTNSDIYGLIDSHADTLHYMYIGNIFPGHIFGAPLVTIISKEANIELSNNLSFYRLIGDLIVDSTMMFNYTQSTTVDNKIEIIITVHGGWDVVGGIFIKMVESELEDVNNIFEHEHTNTTVTSYDKELTIKSSEYQNVDLQIYNMAGQVVNTLTNIELGYSDTKVNMYDNPNGVYFVLVKDNNTNSLERHKVVLIE